MEILNGSAVHALCSSCRCFNRQRKPGGRALTTASSCKSYPSWISIATSCLPHAARLQAQDEALEESIAALMAEGVSLLLPPLFLLLQEEVVWGVGGAEVDLSLKQTMTLSPTEPPTTLAC